MSIIRFSILTSILALLSACIFSEPETTVTQDTDTAFKQGNYLCYDTMSDKQMYLNFRSDDTLKITLIDDTEGHGDITLYTYSVGADTITTVQEKRSEEKKISYTQISSSELDLIMTGGACSSTCESYEIPLECKK